MNWFRFKCALIVVVAYRYCASVVLLATVSIQALLRTERDRPIILLLIICSLLTGCSKLMDYQLDSRSFSSKYLAVVEAETGLRIPAESRGLNMYYCGSERSPSFIAKIEVPKAATDGFVRQIGNIPLRDVHADTNSLAKRMVWWTPLAGTLLIERKFGMPRSTAFVDASVREDAGRTILYIYWAR
jgi:hypothetical protein